MGGQNRKLGNLLREIGGLKRAFGLYPSPKCIGGLALPFFTGRRFKSTQNTIAPSLQSCSNIIAREVRSLIERAHRDAARKAKGRLEYELCHAAST